MKNSCSSARRLSSFLVSILLVIFLIGSQGPSSVETRRKRSFAGLGCMGKYDKIIFSKLNHLCEECYQLYRESEVHGLCRSNCFNNDSFWLCVEALLLKNEKNKLSEMVETLYGR